MKSVFLTTTHVDRKGKYFLTCIKRENENNINVYKQINYYLILLYIIKIELPDGSRENNTCFMLFN